MGWILASYFYQDRFAKSLLLLLLLCVFKYRSMLLLVELGGSKCCVFIS